MSHNCLASVSIGCLFCVQRCNVTKIQVAFTFLPPQSSYTVDSDKDAKGGRGVGRIVYLAEALKTFALYQLAAQCAEVHFVKTAKGERCPLVWLRQRSTNLSQPQREQPLVLLHCHGNATDIGMMMGPYFEMSKQLGIDVVGVEYSGYGVSTGTPNPNRTYADVQAAFDFLVSKGVSPKRIIAYGQSVGSGPATYIAHKNEIGGLILHSPLMSGIKVIDPQPDKCCRPSCTFHCCDFYPTDARLKQATSPTMIIHGQMDDIVPFYHGARLSEMTPAKYRWPGYFPERAGHNDIVESNVGGYFHALHDFIRAVASGSGVPGFQDKPIQVEMMQQGGVILGARDREADMLNNGEDWGGSGGTGHSGISPDFCEPVVGPADGRYAAMRKDKPSVSGAKPSNAH